MGKDHAGKIATIENLYRPENDVAFPRVSHVEKALLEMIKDLLDRVGDLEMAAELYSGGDY